MCLRSPKADKSDDRNARKNSAIDKQIKDDRKRSAREVKMLLLGAGESGKSTVLKQMRLIHARGFTDRERKQWRATIFSNLMHAFQTIHAAMDEHNIDLQNAQNTIYLELIQSDQEIGLEDHMPADHVRAFHELWSDKGIHTALAAGHEYALHDNLDYYLKRVDRLAAKDYIPDDQDILRARLRTTGISETVFETEWITYRMFDVGGQRSERKKWLHVFDNVHVVLFLVALSGYDHVLLEDKNGNQMQEALMLFESIANSEYFAKSGLVLFLNKMDIFSEKILSGKSEIAKFFPDYKGPNRNIDAGANFFADKFRVLVRNPGKELYVHFTNATDTRLLDLTMKSVQDTIVSSNLACFLL